MGFFDTIGKKASEAYSATTKKTGEIAKETKLKMKIAENKSKINDLYEEIGKKVYEKHVKDESIDIKSELEDECTKIDVLVSEIKSCQTSILELKDRKKCPKCDSEIDSNAVFCPKCGEKQPEETVVEAEIVTDETTDESKTEESTEVKTEEKETSIENEENKVEGEE